MSARLIMDDGSLAATIGAAVIADAMKHPRVWPHVSLGHEGDWVGPLMANPSVVKFAGEHGGYMFHGRCSLGRAYDLHAAFAPEGWGREANAVLKRALRELDGWDIITATEVDGNWRSRPPRSFGFRPAGPMRDGFRVHHLTRTAWEQSPAFRRK